MILNWGPVWRLRRNILTKVIKKGMAYRTGA